MVNSYDDMVGSNEDVSDNKFQSSDPVHMAGDVVRLPYTMDSLTKALQGQTMNSLARSDRNYPTDKTNVTPIRK